MATLNLDQIREALAGKAAAFRSVTEYQPAGGPGDKVFPPTYEGGIYATEQRYIDGADVSCVPWTRCSPRPTAWKWHCSMNGNREGRHCRSSA